MNFNKQTSKVFYCFMGAPGVGKGTQAFRISKELGLKHISTGELLRKAMAQKTPLGLKAEGYIQKGQLVPDSIMVGLIEEVLKSLPEKQGAILDGFPRTVVQAQALDKIMRRQNLKIQKCILLVLDEDVLIERMTGRRVAPQSGKVYHVQYAPPQKDGVCDQTGEILIQREDDREEVVRARLEVHKTQQAPLLEYYQKKGLLKEVSAEGSPDEVYLKIKESLKNE